MTVAELTETPLVKMRMNSCSYAIMLEHLLHETVIFIISSIRLIVVPETKQFIQLQDGWIKLLTLAIFNTSFLLINYIIKSSKFHYLYKHLGLYFTCLLADAAKQMAQPVRAPGNIQMQHLFLLVVCLWVTKKFCQKHKISGMSSFPSTLLHLHYYFLLVY